MKAGQKTLALALFLLPGAALARNLYPIEIGTDDAAFFDLDGVRPETSGYKRVVVEKLQRVTGPNGDMATFEIEVDCTQNRFHIVDLIRNYRADGTLLTSQGPVNDPWAAFTPKARINVINRVLCAHTYDGMPPAVPPITATMAEVLKTYRTHPPQH